MARKQTTRRNGKPQYEQPTQNRHTDENTIDFGRYKQFAKKIEIIPRNLHQEDYVCSLLDHNTSIIFATGPAGTGKTMLAVLAAVKALKEGDIQRIVVTRPAVEVDNERHGFLPGDLNAKMEPWTKPIFDVLHEHFTPRETASMLEEQIIEICPLAFMRGRNLKDSFIIADEMQNASINQMKMLLTRLASGSKMVVTGDLKQLDKKFHNDNGLVDFLERLSQSNSQTMQVVKFDVSDVQRHPVVGEVLQMYGEE